MKMAMKSAFSFTTREGYRTGLLYTTNAIESFNSALRKVTDRKAAFPNEMAVMKILYLRTLDVVKKWTMPYPNWSLIRGKLDFLWGVGWDF